MKSERNFCFSLKTDVTQSTKNPNLNELTLVILEGSIWFTA